MKNICKTLCYVNDIESSAIEDTEDTTPGNSIKQFKFTVNQSTSIFEAIDSITPNAHDKKVRILIKGNQEELGMNKALILKSKEDQKSELKSEENYHLIISDETHEKFGYKYYIEKDSSINEYQKKFPYEPKSLTFDE
ncbi:hypothetical protein LY90DRAFT_520175 [Neocallimastix californiae]|uniref:Uncharacterized protein n=1 Tax=Neocallimastix californiae TaxID=1754190 RepID=A0A1Y1YFM8_9FUNG|nr:hypothetical protein LY90DRAFT_520175 [Neocallimastix californiae]|eukprot:ORX96812.1 hypothetical protein LY90DRAFT_520175 [Neocallimastix californiae]